MIVAEHVEYRFVELRYTEGRTVTGTALRYGERARMPWGWELIESRAFGDLSASDLILNIMHDRKVPIARSGSGLSITDSAESLSFDAKIANTRAGDDALELVRTGILRGASVEFRTKEDAWEGNVRRILSATLRGIGLADRPSYPSSLVEARTQAAAAHSVAAPAGRVAWPLL